MSGGSRNINSSWLSGHKCAARTMVPHPSSVLYLRHSVELQPPFLTHGSSSYLPSLVSTTKLTNLLLNISACKYPMRHYTSTEVNSIFVSAKMKGLMLVLILPSLLLARPIVVQHNETSNYPLQTHDKSVYALYPRDSRSKAHSPILLLAILRTTSKANLKSSLMPRTRILPWATVPTIQLIFIPLAIRIC